MSHKSARAGCSHRRNHGNPAALSGNVMAEFLTVPPCPRSGKTSMLFQLAFNAASVSEDATAVFITRKAKISKQPPQPVSLAPLPDAATSSWAPASRASDSVLKRVHMK